MLGFIKKLFGAKPAETVAEVPYKVEVVEPAPAVQDYADIAIAQIPAPVKEVPVVEAKPAKAPKAKKPPAKKPRKPKATK